MTTEERIKQLEELKRQLLMHCVGMDYNMQQVFEINKELKLLLERSDSNGRRQTT